MLVKCITRGCTYAPSRNLLICINLGMYFSDTLRLVLPDEEVVQKLSHAVHTNVEVHDDMLNQLSDIKIPSKLNIWIDPIG